MLSAVQAEHQIADNNKALLQLIIDVIAHL